MAELLLRDAVAGRPDGDGWDIRSAGLHTRGSRPIHPSAGAVLAELGIASGGFTSRPLDVAAPLDQDLVLTATRAHRADVVRAYPAILSRIFTLRQFNYLLDGAEPLSAGPIDTTGAAWVALAKAARAELPGRTDLDDIADPVNDPIAEFRRLAGDLTSLFATALRAVPPST